MRKEPASPAERSRLCSRSSSGGSGRVDRRHRHRARHCDQSAAHGPARCDEWLCASDSSDPRAQGRGRTDVRRRPGPSELGRKGRRGHRMGRWHGHRLRAASLVGVGVWTRQRRPLADRADHACVSLQVAHPQGARDSRAQRSIPCGDRARRRLCKPRRTPGRSRLRGTCT